MDHLGAVLGPLCAFALLAAGLEVGEVYLWAIVPGLAALALLWFGLPRVAAAPMAPPAKSAQFQAFGWSRLHPRVRALVGAAGTLSIASVPEAFLVLWAASRGLGAQWLPLLWAATNLLKSAVTLPAGLLADRHGRIRLLLGGWSLRIACLLALASMSPAGLGIWGLFMLYGAAVAVTEPAERALIGDHAAAGERGAAFGWYHLVVGLLALPGALLFGSLWQWVGSGAAFATAAALTALAAAGMLLALRAGLKER
jgi:MFS family permease